MSGGNFGELGVRPEFVSAFGNRRAFFASTTPGGDDLNLAAGELWYSFDGGSADLLNAVADLSGGAGTTTLTLLNSNLSTVATSTNSGSLAKLSYQAAPGQSYFLKVTGTNPSIDLRTYFGQTWQNVFNALDVNNDHTVSPVDVLVVINALNARGNALTAADLTSGMFLDVTGDKSLTPLVVLTVINHINAHSTASGSTSSLQPNGLVAQALAVDAAMDDWSGDATLPASDEASVRATASTVIAPHAADGFCAAADSLSDHLPRRKTEPAVEQQPL
jgi:hypothetical protein